MVKKLQKMADKQAAATGGIPAGLLDSQLAATVRDSAQQIWLAGLGAFSKAQEEGTKVFEKLVEEGTSLQKKTRGVAEDRISEVTGKMTAMASDVTSKAGQQWDKLESIFEDRVAKAMGRLGVPSSKDMQALVARIDALGDKVAAMSSKAPAARGAAARKAPAKKRAVRRTASAEQ